jgi:tetratricopeptide (TPR) repeat protein
MVHRARRDLPKAKEELQQALAIEKKVFGDRHPQVAKTLHNLGAVLKESGDSPGAEAVFLEAVDIRRNAPGIPRTDVAYSLFNLAVTLRSRGDLARAELPLREAVEICRQQYTNRPARLEPFLSELADLFSVQHKFSDAELLMREMRTGLAGRLRDDDEKVVNLTASLAHVLTEWAWDERPGANAAPGDASGPAAHAREAERLLRDCLTTRLLTLGTNSSRVADTRSRLGGAIVAVAVVDSSLDAPSRLARFAEAESHLLESSRVLQASRSLSGPPQRQALERLVRLYEAWDAATPGQGKAVQAGQWKHALAAFQQAATERQSKPNSAESDGQPGKK